MQAAGSAGGRSPCIFDIVNGFLIDAVAHRVRKLGGCKAGQDRRGCGTDKAELGASPILADVDFG